VTIGGVIVTADCAIDPSTLRFTCTATSLPITFAVPNGPVSWTIAPLVDVAGNVGSGTGWTSNNGTTDGRSVTVDQGALVVQSITTRSNNTRSPARAVKGDLVTLDISVSRPIRIPVLSYSVCVPKFTVDSTPRTYNESVR
jgi:hypothetical protein